MIRFLSIGTLAIGFIIIIYTLVTASRNIFNNQRSLRDSEKIHRYLLVIGGLIAGLGLGSIQEFDFQSIQEGEINYVSDEFLISILLSIAGLIVILFGTTFLKSQLWSPLENISEYSAEFGTNFIATRLPETGGIELENFSKRFNQNAISLANKISKLEIQVDKIEESLGSTVSAGKELNSTTQSLNDIAINYTSSTKNQFEVVSEIAAHVNEFVTWYDDTKETLTENFVELRSLSELGNLIAINAAVEASNLEIPNPGFETLAERLRELARSLENRQEGMKQLIDQINNNYDLFKDQIQLYLNQAILISDKTNSISDEIDSILHNISIKNLDFSDTYERLGRSIKNFKTSIPTAYI